MGVGPVIYLITNKIRAFSTIFYTNFYAWLIWQWNKFLLEWSFFRSLPKRSCLGIYLEWFRCKIYPRNKKLSIILASLTCIVRVDCFYKSTLHTRVSQFALSMIRKYVKISKYWFHIYYLKKDMDLNDCLLNCIMFKISRGPWLMDKPVVSFGFSSIWSQTESLVAQACNHIYV